MSRQDQGTIYLQEGMHLELPGAPRTGANALITRLHVKGAITIKVYEIRSDTAPTAVYSVTPDITADPGDADYSECMFDTAQTDDRFPRPYTFWYRIPTSAYAFEGGKQYQVEATIPAGFPVTTWPDLADEGPRILVWRVVCNPTYGA